MKTGFILTLMLFITAAKAQDHPKDTTEKTFIDSSKIKVPITLKAEHHFLIVDCLESVNKSEWTAYAVQVAKGMDTLYRPSKLITVTLESGMVADLYFQMCAQQERYSATLNSELRNTLVVNTCHGDPGFLDVDPRLGFRVGKCKSLMRV